MSWEAYDNMNLNIKINAECRSKNLLGKSEAVLFNKQTVLLEYINFY